MSNFKTKQIELMNRNKKFLSGEFRRKKQEELSQNKILAVIAILAIIGGLMCY